MRREILKLSAGWVLCAAAWAACGGEKTVTNTKYGYQIGFPNDYLVYSGEAKGDSKDVIAYVHVDELKEGDSLRSFFKCDFYKELFQLCTLTDIRIVKLDGRSAIKYTALRGGERWVIYYVVANARGYGICSEAPDCDYDKYAKQIDAIVASFKIIEAK